MEEDIIICRVFGDKAEEMEMSALDEARYVFGQERALRIQHGFQIIKVMPSHHYDTDKKYFANIKVFAMAVSQ